MESYCYDKIESLIKMTREEHAVICEYAIRKNIPIKRVISRYAKELIKNSSWDIERVLSKTAKVPHVKKEEVKTARYELLKKDFLDVKLFCKQNDMYLARFERYIIMTLVEKIEGGKK